MSEKEVGVQPLSMSMAVSKDYVTGWNDCLAAMRRKKLAAPDEPNKAGDSAHGSDAQAVPAPAVDGPSGDFQSVPAAFVSRVLDLAHNYSLEAIPPDYYWALERECFKEAYRRIGRDLAELRAMLAAARAKGGA